MKQPYRGPYGGYAVAALMLLFCHALYYTGCAARGADPAVPVVVVPTKTPPAPAAVDTMALDQMLVFTCTVNCSVSMVPEGVVTVTQESGPIKIRGKFADGNGQTQCRTYPDKYLWIVEPVASGKVTIVVTPVGATIATKIPLTIGDVPPQPPPGPGPTPPTDPLTKALQDAFAAETDTQKAAKIADLAGVYAKVGDIKAIGTVTTLGQLQATMRRAEILVVGANGLPKVLQAGSAYVAGKLPANDAPMTDTLWRQASDAYGAVAIALKKVQVK
jgi:hypothetical protein